jgi:HSP20 family molecular chaperone IbpA
MHPRTLELMEDQTRAIYRAVTGVDLPDPAPSTGPEVQIEEVARRFADLEAMARTFPAVVERVPPFSFAPPFDALDEGRTLLIELAVPGLERGDVTVERTDDLLIVSGVRTGERASNGRTYLHAEIPRGPFHRVIRLPLSTTSEPRVEVDRGLIRIHLTKVPATSAKV